MEKDYDCFKLLFLFCKFVVVVVILLLAVNMYYFGLSLSFI